LRVNIHGGSNICMPQKFLLHLEIDVERMKQSGMAVTKREPADRPSPDFSPGLSWVRGVTRYFVVWRGDETKRGYSLGVLPERGRVTGQECRIHPGC
jgi:hypothetical protein